QTQGAGPSRATPPPNALKLSPSSPPRYYEITTTATFTGSVTVCVTYNQSDVSGNESHLKLMVYDTSLAAWVNITTSLDVQTNVICGTTTHFSEFALMEPQSSLAVEAGLPGGFRLYPGMPNPTRSGATIRFAVPHETSVRVGIYDTGGRLVRELMRGAVPAGDHASPWDGLDASGQAVPNGLYLVR